MGVGAARIAVADHRDVGRSHRDRTLRHRRVPPASWSPASHTSPVPLPMWLRMSSTLSTMSRPSGADSAAPSIQPRRSTARRRARANVRCARNGSSPERPSAAATSPARAASRPAVSATPYQRTRALPGLWKAPSRPVATSLGSCAAATRRMAASIPARSSRVDRAVEGKGQVPGIRVPPSAAHRPVAAFATPQRSPTEPSAASHRAAQRRSSASARSSAVHPFVDDRQQRVERVNDLHAVRDVLGTVAVRAIDQDAG